LMASLSRAARLRGLRRKGLRRKVDEVITIIRSATPDDGRIHAVLLDLIRTEKLKAFLVSEQEIRFCIPDDSKSLLGENPLAVEFSADDYDGFCKRTQRGRGADA